MNDLVYPRERTLGAITLVLGLLAWAALLIGTRGVALAVVALGFVAYLFVHSALIAHIRGSGVELSPTQFPDLYSQFTDCCARLQIKEPPQAFILNGNGVLNAFATKFLRTKFVVLNSDTVDAMAKHPDGARFYIGHELGHLRMKHLSGRLPRWPVLWLPLLGAAYSRARESTCDRHGLACSSSPENAARALAALATGSERWQQLDVAAYLAQNRHTSGFWMSLHELTAGYPWLIKRAARVMDSNAALPRRNGFAYLLAIFIPYTGQYGAGFGLLVMVYVIGVLAAIAIPAYKNYTVRAKVSMAVAGSQSARETLGTYYLANHKPPESLEAAGLPSGLSDGSPLSLDAVHMVLTVTTKEGELIFVPALDSQGRVTWTCRNGEGLRPAQLPASCRGNTAP